VMFGVWLAWAANDPNGLTTMRAAMRVRETLRTKDVGLGIDFLS
jgi:hypothetical protein